MSDVIDSRNLLEELKTLDKIDDLDRIAEIEELIEDVKDWKAQEKEWIEQDFAVADDSIKLLGELKNNNLDVVLQKINEEIRDAN